MSRLGSVHRDLVMDHPVKGGQGQYMGVDPNADTKRKSDKILVNLIANTEIRNDTTRVRSAESLTWRHWERGRL